jgi:hypothetical protein
MSMRDYRLWLIVGGIAAVIVLFFLLRPSDDDEAATTTAATPTATAPPETTTVTETLTEKPPGVTVTEEQPPTVTEPQRPTLDVTVRGGAPVGGIARATVDQGDSVLIVVRSDVADEVHVHGYDLTADVSPGTPAQITFDASLAGGFEIELEEAGLEIAELRVEP